MLDPGAYVWVSALADREVVFADAEEGFCGVESSRVEDAVDGNSEEICEGLKERSVVGYEC